MYSDDRGKLTETKMNKNRQKKGGKWQTIEKHEFWKCAETNKNIYDYKVCK